MFKYQCPIEDLPAEKILHRAAQRRREGYRLVQIQATYLKDSGNELIYNFALYPESGKDDSFCGYRLHGLQDGERIPSISSIFPQAFLYENEIADLFGLKFTNMSIDYRGGLFRTNVPKPYETLRDEKGGKKA